MDLAQTGWLRNMYVYVLIISKVYSSTRKIFNNLILRNEDSKCSKNFYY